MTDTVLVKIGSAELQLAIHNGMLKSIGHIEVDGTPLRNPETRFLPWFDTYEGDIFRHFRFEGVEMHGQTTVVRTTAQSDPDTLFRERRDSSGDVCFRPISWDSPVREGKLNICFDPAKINIEGRYFSGFRYWFEYHGELPIHRLVDRQTWEVGGNLDDVTICLRNWLTPPSMKIARDTTYSTVGLDKWASLLPGNLWARWTLLPGFDMQYGEDGILITWFDQVSLIRSVIESNAGEDSLRVVDLHLFAQDNQVKTNAKTVLYCPDKLDAIDALNLWTRIQDREEERGKAQFNMPVEEPPAIVFSQNDWRNINFDSTYEHMIEVAAEFGGDYIFIDVVFEQEEAYNEQLKRLIPPDAQRGTILEKHHNMQNMCCILDWKVNDVWGGEEGLTRLCNRARTNGLKVLSWMSTHASPNSYLHVTDHPKARDLGGGTFGVYAARESGRHPDTGYPGECWPFNLNTPVMEWLGDSLLEVCERTGLAGFLWDSVSNLGWWQLDYSQGSMRPQYDRFAQLWSRLQGAGLYIQPEGLVSFSTHSCCGLHGGNVYAGELLGYSYNTSISMNFHDNIDEDISTYEKKLLHGEVTVDMLFQYLAHKRVPSLTFHRVPREEWHAPSIAEIKRVLVIYRQLRGIMIRRTVLKNGLGVLWDGGDAPVLFAFSAAPASAGACDATTGASVTAFEPNHAYLLTGDLAGVLNPSTEHSTLAAEISEQNPPLRGK